MKFETLQVHAGQTVDETTKSRAVPIYQTTSYLFDNSDHGADLFALKKPGNIYTRLSNPTTDVFEQRIAALEGGIGGLAVAWGQTAATYSILNIASSGDNIVISTNVYGGTYSLLSYTLPNVGVTGRFFNIDDLEQMQSLIDDRTRAIFVESIGNPNCNVPDFEAIAEIAHRHRIPLIVDNTFATPYLFRPIEHGADIVMHSATKFIGGHGTSIGGVVIDSGNFDWEASGKFDILVKPNASYHDMEFCKEFGKISYLAKMRTTLLRDMGACLSPFNSFLFIQGLETLSLRVERHNENALKVVDYLAQSPYVEKVNHPSLPDNPYHQLAKKYFGKYSGSIFTFELKGGLEKTKQFTESLQLFSLLANVADAKSLVIHPASTTHAQMTEKDMSDSGIFSNTIRLSIGLEHIDDIIEDLDQAFNKVFKG